MCATVIVRPARSSVYSCGCACSPALRAVPTCPSPAASSASSVAVTPAKPRSTEWFDAVEQPSQPCARSAGRDRRRGAEERVPARRGAGRRDGHLEVAQREVGALDPGVQRCEQRPEVVAAVGGARAREHRQVRQHVAGRDDRELGVRVGRRGGSRRRGRRRARARRGGGAQDGRPAAAPARSRRPQRCRGRRRGSRRRAGGSRGRGPTGERRPARAWRVTPGLYGVDGASPAPL